MQFKINNLIYAILIFAAICFAGTSALAQRKYLFKWDQGSGTTMPGWTWSNDVAYGHPGWTLNADGPFGGGKTYMWGYGPRSFEKGGDSGGALAMLDTQNRAPSTTSGGALKVYDDDNNNHFPGWWLWYDGETLSDKNITNSDTNRWSFYIKLEGTTPATSTEPAAVFHVGTYLCEHTGLPTYGTGDGCPYEGPGNQHYYHYLYMSPGAWIHVLLDQHPTHKRDSFVPGNDPAYIAPPKDSSGQLRAMHYMEHLHQWYMEIRYDQSSPTDYLLDEMYFYSTKDASECSEPDQNDLSVTSLWVGYWPETGKWQIGWQDMSFTDASGLNLNDNTHSTFEIRWSTTPITNENYSSANIVSPEWFSGPTVTSFPNGLRRADPWWPRVWTQFDLPEGVEQSNSVIYFAIKDVSNIKANAGTNWPFNKPDGHNAPSPYIKTINYHINSSANTPKPSIINIDIN